MNRVDLPRERVGIRMPVEFVYPNGDKTIHTISYNLGPDCRVIECFFAHDSLPQAKGGQLCELLEDGCKLLSRCLQYGDTIQDLAKYCGENIPEGATSGRPSSIIGAIARAGVDLERALAA